MKKILCTLFFIILLAFLILFFIRQRLFQQYVSLQELKKQTVPRIIYVAWLSNTEMSYNRKNSIEKLRSSAKLPVKLILNNNLKDIEISSHQFHPAYWHLCDVLKSDYLRAYLMHFHGGAWADVKPFEDKSWEPAFDDLEKSSAYGNGVPEREGWAAVPADFGDEKTRKIREDAKDLLITNCAFIFRAQTPFTLAWLSSQEERLDVHTEALQNHPSKLNRSPRDSWPLRWEELQGEIFHPLVYEAQMKSAGNAFLRTVPQFSTSNYM
jgi:hypothetical protein